MAEKLWFTKKPSEVLDELHSTKEGLSGQEASERLKEHGKNQLPRKKRAAALIIFLRQFKSPLIYVLLIAGIVEMFFREFVDAAIILSAVAINTIVGFFQENKAEEALDKLHEFISYNAKVIRNGSKVLIDSREVVPGDIIFVEAGDRVPADGRLFYINDLEVNEASLTGESVPVAKDLELLEKGTVTGDQVNMVFMGTIVTKGQGRFVVTETGSHTQLGEIAGMLKETREDPTPLQHKIKRLSVMLSWIVAIIGALIFVEGLFRGFDLFEMFETAVAVAVAAIPEGLVISITVILTLGMQRILKKNALVRKLVAAETLGSTSIICSDKTGTLTLGEMHVTTIATGTSDDQSAQADFENPKQSEKFDDILRAIDIAVVSSTAEAKVDEATGEERIIGDPTEIALLRAAHKLDLDEGQIRQKYKKLDEIPFSSEKKYAATLAEYDEDNNIIYIKGAPEVIVSGCENYLLDGDEMGLKDEKKKVLQKNEELTGKGLRVLAVAYKLVSKEAKEIDEESVLEGLTYTALFGIKDPLRKESKHMLETTKTAGIRTVIITGDHKLTVSAIARDLGMKVTDDNVIEGHEMDDWSDEELKERVRQIDIYARVSPRHKIRIVDAWQSHGEVVAMIGDGVNDAPAIKSADIGVAVGSGTDVSKEAADLVLLDNNFKTIVAAVEQGRMIFDNIRKVILYLLVDSFSEVILVGGALLIGVPLPITAIQILYINVITDGFPGLAMAFEPGEEGVMKKKPRKKDEHIINKELRILIFLIGIITDIGLFAIYFYLLNKGIAIEHIRTIIFTALAIDSLLYVFSCKSLSRPIWKINLLGNKLLLVAVAAGFGLQMFALYFPPIKDAMELVQLHGTDWAIIVGAALIKITAIEIGKSFFWKKTQS